MFFIGNQIFKKEKTNIYIYKSILGAPWGRTAIIDERVREASGPKGGLVLIRQARKKGEVTK